MVFFKYTFKTADNLTKKNFLSKIDPFLKSVYFKAVDIKSNERFALRIHDAISIQFNNKTLPMKIFNIKDTEKSIIIDNFNVNNEIKNYLLNILNRKTFYIELLQEVEQKDAYEDTTILFLELMWMDFRELHLRMLK